MAASIIDYFVKHNNPNRVAFQHCKITAAIGDKADVMRTSRNVRLWHETAVPIHLRHVRYQGMNGLNADIVE
jgi:hypothetical protein